MKRFISSISPTQRVYRQPVGRSPEPITPEGKMRYAELVMAPGGEWMVAVREDHGVTGRENLSCPIVFFQGADDKVVPPNQAESMFDAVRESGLPTAYLVFEGEGHGFRRADNIKRALDSELYFYGRVFGFAPADELEPIEIENL